MMGVITGARGVSGKASTTRNMNDAPMPLPVTQPAATPSDPGYSPADLAAFTARSNAPVPVAGGGFRFNSRYFWDKGLSVPAGGLR